MIPRRLIQIHLGGPMPDNIARWTKSVREKNPAFEYKLFTERELFVAGYDLPALREKYGSWAAITNYLRLVLVNEQGGIFCDTDVEALKPFDELLNYNSFAAFQDNVDGGRLCNAIFGATKDHPWLLWQIQNVDTGLTRDPATGPYHMTAAPRYDLEILPTAVLYPWHWNDPKELKVPKPESITSHFWVGSWINK